MFVATGLMTISCNNYLDLEPITDVATTEYLYAENDLGAYAANLYVLICLLAVSMGKATWLFLPTGLVITWDCLPMTMERIIRQRIARANFL